MPMIGDEMMHKFCVATQKKENIKIQERCEKIRRAVSFAGNWNHLDLATWILEYGPLVLFSPINMGSNFKRVFNLHNNGYIP
jgi:hypothetical protein